MEHARRATKVNERPTWSERNPAEYCSLPKYRKLTALRLEVFEYFIAGGCLKDVASRFGPLVNCLALNKLKREADIWNYGYKARENEFDQKERRKARELADSEK